MCASRLKRASRSSTGRFVSASGSALSRPSEGSTLTATSRPRWVSCARYTSPIPPRPMVSMMAKRPATMSPARADRPPGARRCRGSGAAPVGAKHALHLGDEPRVAAAGLIDRACPLGRRPTEHLLEDVARAPELDPGSEPRTIRGLSSQCSACVYVSSGQLSVPVSCPTRHRDGHRTSGDNELADQLACRGRARPGSALFCRSPPPAANRRRPAPARTPDHTLEPNAVVRRAVHPAHREPADFLPGPGSFLRHRGPDHAPHPHRPCARPGRREAWRTPAAGRALGYGRLGRACAERATARPGHPAVDARNGRSRARRA